MEASLRIGKIDIDCIEELDKFKKSPSWNLNVWNYNREYNGRDNKNLAIQLIHASDFHSTIQFDLTIQEALLLSYISAILTGS